MGAATAGSGIQVGFQNFMYFAGPIMQVVFWLVLGVCAIWACLIFKRYVDFMSGAVSEEMSKPAEKPVSVEEFVD
jgi:hypothetical protein